MSRRIPGNILPRSVEPNTDTNLREIVVDQDAIESRVAALEVGGGVSLPITPTQGGTGLTAVSTGDILYGSGTDTWARLPIGAADYFLKSNGTNIEWVASGGGGSVDWGDITNVPATFPPESHTHTWAEVSKAGSSLADLATRSILDTTGTLTVGRGGTGLATLTAAGRLLYSTGTSALTTLAIGSSGQVLRVSSSAPAWETPPWATISGSVGALLMITGTHTAEAIELPDDPGGGGADVSGLFLRADVVDNDPTYYWSEGALAGSLSAGDGIDGGQFTGDAHITWDLDIWAGDGVEPNLGRTAFTSTGQLAVGLGTGGNEAAAGNHDHSGVYAPAIHDLVSSSHSASGLTSGHVLRATGSTSFAFGALQLGDLPASVATIGTGPVGSLMMRSDTNTITDIHNQPLDEVSGQFLQASVTGGNVTYTWTTAALSGSLIAGDGLTGGTYDGTTSRTWSVATWNPGAHTETLRGKTTMVDGEIAVILGTSGDEAAAGNHTHGWSEVSKAGSSLADLATRNISDTTGTLATSRGGTGLTTYGGVGRIIYSSGSSTLTTLTPGVAGTYLRSGGTSNAPTWSSPTFTEISGTIATGQVSGAYTGITGLGTQTSALNFNVTGDVNIISLDASEWFTITRPSGYAHFGWFVERSGSAWSTTHGSLDGVIWTAGQSGALMRLYSIANGTTLAVERWQVGSTGILNIGSVPAARITAGTFGTGAYAFPSTVSVAGVASFAVGTAGAPGIAFTVEPTTGMRRTGAHTGALCANGSEPFIWTPTLVTSTVSFSAATTFNASGAATFGSSVTISGALVVGGTAEFQSNVYLGATDRLYFDGTGGNTYMTEHSTDQVRLFVASTTAMQWESTVTYSHNEFRPGTSNTYDLGDPSYRWANLYSVLGNFSGAVTMSSTLGVTGAVTAGSITASAAILGDGTSQYLDIEEAAFIRVDGVRAVRVAGIYDGTSALPDPDDIPEGCLVYVT